MASAKKTPEALLCGERIRMVRTALGLSRRELARKAKVGYSTLSNYEQGLRELPIRKAKRIEEATGVPAAYVMGLIGVEDKELLQAPEVVRAALVAMIRQIAASPVRPEPPIPFPQSVPQLIRTARRRS